MAAQGGAVMPKPVLDDALWGIIEPLLPPPKKRRRRYPGRKPIDNRSALCAILFVLKTGLPWEYLPQELGWGSGMTAWRRLHAWQRKGVWQKIHEALLAHLREADRIDWSRAVVDSSSVRAVHGGKKRDRIPQIAANPAASSI
jgi:transposase